MARSETDYERERAEYDALPENFCGGAGYTAGFDGSLGVWTEPCPGCRACEDPPRRPRRKGRRWNGITPRLRR